MRNLLNYYIVLVLILVSCGEEEFVGQPPLDSNPPGQISNVSVENIPGGAIIKYTLPKEKDILYIEATYAVNSELIRVAKSSKFNQYIVVDGFGDTQEYEVELRSVDYGGNKSKPLKETIKPLEPPYLKVFNSLEIESDFSGVLLSWENVDKVDMGITVLKEDALGNFVPFKTVYEDYTDYSENVRGLDSITQTLGFFVKDKYKNVSDTIFGTFKPLYEQELDKALWTALRLDTDIPQHANARRVEKGFDGILHQNYARGYVSTFRSELHYLPHHQTIDFGVKAKISRFIIYSVEYWGYKRTGIKKLELYGTNDEALIDRERNGAYVWPNGDDPNDTGNWREEGLDGWNYIDEFEIIKPSGLPGIEVTQEDDDYAQDGIEFNFPPGIPAYRYYRFRSVELWDSGSKHSGWSEITFFGQPQ
ncbi:DUF4959 domain-containing protein [Snuella sedimenti]|uniref:DUF4959 domain-containing protein n=1 Tax=Snuella sedimenti TaxID=2798802 RepID=A0A8J7IZN1_9FLAO|nr:DUF4959 domain-containing protein [Snuella sedimenti]MBJ6369605.1 DUF4959 domain-containing protein [Snuella sedimenti]